MGSVMPLTDLAVEFNVTSIYIDSRREQWLGNKLHLGLVFTLLSDSMKASR
jgi:hypothetical protein